MAEELKQTKIPRFESGSSSSITRIPKPSGFARPNASTVTHGISKLVRPQLNGIASKNTDESNSTTTITTVTSSSTQAKGAFESTAVPRKTILRRFGVANKVQIKTLPRLLSNAPLKASQFVANKVAAAPNDVRTTSNETIELTRDAAMNVTKPVINAQNTDATMDRSLTRSNTFVCDTVDDTQVKLLSITHNVNAPPAPNDTINHTNQQQMQLNKERTFKRSLSPIPGETTNSAKRKLMQVSADKTMMMGPLVNSTPRRSISYSDARKANLAFFNGTSDLHIDQLQTFTFDNNTFEQSNNFAADATQLGKAASSTMQSNRMFNLTQTVQQNGGGGADSFYPENRNANQTLDANVAEHERKNGDASKTNTLHTNYYVHDANDGNLTKTINVEKTQPIQIVGSGPLNEDLLVAKKRFSLGLELPECTLDCSIELCDSSAATSAQDSSPLVNYNPHSYEMDESLGILTPDQMIEFLDTNATHPKVELPMSLPVKIGPHKCHVDQTPSPEELPLDPVGVKTLETSKIEDADITLQPSSICDHDGTSQADSYSKNDQMTKSSTSKVTNSFITSVTSIASLDNGYHADGEMSRPASRGAESPMRRAHNARQNKIHSNSGNVAVIRRQDPMTDSDFFTESDADDIFHRGERRHVQIIDGHMYNAQGADIFIDEAPAENDMESSGIYTDAEHRADDEAPSHNDTQNENESDMSPDGSTDTIKSSEYVNDKSKKSMPKADFDTTKQAQSKAWTAQPTHSTQSIAALSNSSSTTTNNDSVATCLCEKSSVKSGNGVSDRAGNGGDLAQLVINDATKSIHNEKTSCTLHSISRTDNDNSNSTTGKTAPPQFKSNGTPKVKRFSPNRKQCKSETVSAHGKRNETVKRDSKSATVRNRSNSSAIGNNSKKSPGISSSNNNSNNSNRSHSKSPIENGRNSEISTINMTSDQTVQHVRKAAPNKWDAVMNKIALNKAEVKTVKYSEVKSKVTCRLKRISPNSKTTLSFEQSTASDSGNSSLTSTKSSASPITRQSSHGVSKSRSVERDSSKDSHLSSNRETTVATPGRQLKSTTPSSRSSARKRSSIQNGFSSNDIKIEAVAKTDSPPIKPASLHKRFSGNNNNNNQTASATASPVTEKRSSITASKKSSSTTKQHVNQSTAPVANKTSHAKEHGLQTTLAHPPTINNNNSSINNNNHSTKSGTNTTKLPPAAATAPSVAVNDDHQPIIASIHRNGKSSATMPAANKAVAVPQVKSKKTTKSLANGELNENLIEFSIIDSHDGNSFNSDIDPNALSMSDKAKRNVNQQQHQQQLDKSTPADLNVIRANKTIVALSVLIQHLTTNLKAFDTPSLRAALETAKDKLLESQRNLETMRTKCLSLEDQMRAKEHFFTSHELALKEASERELEKLKLNLVEMERSAQEQIQALRFELEEINHQHADALKAYQMRADNRCSELESQLQMSRDRERELVERLNNCTVTENQLRDKVQASEQEFAQRLIAATARERELNDKVVQLTLQLKASDDKRIDLEEKVKLACDETSALRHRRSSIDHSLPNLNGSILSSSPVMLEEEVLSLRTVLDMKLNEISELRKQNQMNQSAQDELPKAQLKISILESRLEDLTIQLKTKVEEEQELSSQNRSLQEMYNQEFKNRTRLALHNEELQWKLKQNSEKYNSTLSELSKSYQNSSLLADFKNSLYAPISETSQEHSNTEAHHTTSSPPSSPGGHLVKGVVEKCDSVSYVLELNDDEPAEAVVNRVVKRAGSFRANNFKERSPSFKRQLSLGGANALSQSASATSLLRQHSDSPVKCTGSSAKIQKSSRTRSNSLNASNEPKKVHRLPVELTPNDYAKWHSSMNTMSTSSPLTSRPHNKKNGHTNGLLDVDDGTGVKTRSSSMSTDDAEAEMSKPFMSCDSNEDGSNLCATILPAPNKLKKRPQIKESAGEAMVSQQSEDDQSFGSDIDSASASSSSAASPSHSEASKHRHLSLDEEAFMNKIVASLTPMEVSWSEDGEIEPYAQESSA